MGPAESRSVGVPGEAGRVCAAHASEVTRFEPTDRPRDRRGTVTPGGVAWSTIAEELGVSLEQALQRYRDAAYEHWDTGWQLSTVTDGMAFVESTDVHWDSLEPSAITVRIPEVRGDTVPLGLDVADGEMEIELTASLTPQQCRDLASALGECADIASGEP